MKMFNKIIMASEFDVNKLKAGVFHDEEGKEAAVEDGALVSIKEPMAHDLYANQKDLNARKITAFDAEAPIYGVVDYVGVSHADVMGVKYRIGDKLAGVYPTAGERTRVRMLELGDEFYLCNENFDGEAAIGKFAAPAAGKTTWALADAKAEKGLCIEIEDVKPLIMGQVNEGSMMFRCRVISL
jgi:hypothetical protein